MYDSYGSKWLLYTAYAKHASKTLTRYHLQVFIILSYVVNDAYDMAGFVHTSAE